MPVIHATKEDVYQIKRISHATAVLVTMESTVNFRIITHAKIILLAMEDKTVVTYTSRHVAVNQDSMATDVSTV